MPDLNLHYLKLELARIDVLLAAAVEQWRKAGRDPNDAFRGLVVTDDEIGSLVSMPFSANRHPADHANGNGAAAAEMETVAATQREILRESAAVADLAARQNMPLRFRNLVETFGLDNFERDALLICLAPGLDLRYEQIYSYLQNDINKRLPTVSLILDLLSAPGIARLSLVERFVHSSRLLSRELIEYHHEPGVSRPSLLGQLLAVDRTVITWLLGTYRPRPELARYVHLETIRPDARRNIIVGPHLAELEHAATVSNPLFLYFGHDLSAQTAAAGYVASRLRRPLLSADFGSLHALGHQPSQLLRWLLRDAKLNDAVLFIHGFDACFVDQSPPAHLVEELYRHDDAVIVASKISWQPHEIERNRIALPLSFDFPDYAHRKSLWSGYLEKMEGLSEDVDALALAGQFTLTSGQIRDAVATARDRAIQRNDLLRQSDLFAGARMHSGVHLTDLARKITPRYDWNDIILPDDQKLILHEIVMTVRGRSKVLEEWGLGKKLASSAAVTVLFAGPPGTGKTMAAEVIAGELSLDLYKIDLSNLVSKYIGETEKNLERIFTEAQSSNAILFFDEADAIFGKRGGVKDARDRYANIEISYLLQRMELYDGVTILATNLRSNMDEAFLRRLQFAIDIPFPDEKDRLRIWQTLFPRDIPHAPDLNLEEMARRFRLAGGNIRNIIVTAAYLAAADGGVLTMKHLLHGTRRELQKMGRLVAEDQMRVEA